MSGAALSEAKTEMRLPGPKTMHTSLSSFDGVWQQNPTALNGSWNMGMVTEWQLFSRSLVGREVRGGWQPRGAYVECEDESAMG